MSESFATTIARPFRSFRDFFKKELFDKGLNSIPGAIFLSLIGILTAYAGTKLGFPNVFVIPLGLAFITVFISLFINPKIGYFGLLLLSFFLVYILRFARIEESFGWIVDYLILVTASSVLIHKLLSRKRDWSYFGNPVTYITLIFLSFYLIQLANPEKPSFIGWLQYFRREIVFTFIYFIVLELFDSIAFFKGFIAFWLVLATVAGLYGCYQQFFGFSNQEFEFINSSDKILHLILTEGVYRKFSLFSDPTTFGILMGTSSIFFMVMLTGPFSFRKKALYFVCLVIMLLGMVFSGTRTAYAMILCGVAIFSLMTLNKGRTLIVVSMFALVLLAVLFGPFSGNRSVQRIRSLFEFSGNASMNVRDVNRHYIQPYIYTHPFGGGLATTGTPGTLVNGGSVLAGFPPDSELLRVVLEMGWLGLFLVMLRFFIILRTGIRSFYLSKNEENKTYLLGMIAVMYSIIFAAYSQDTFYLMPNVIFFFTFMAMISKMPRFEDPAPEK